MDGANSDDDDDEYIDEEEANLNMQERENLQNERLLKRLYKAAQADIDAENEAQEAEEGSHT